MSRAGSRGSDRTATLLALGLASALGGSGVVHLVAPEVFTATVPPPLPAGATVLVSGVVELAVAALLVAPRTRPLGGWAAAVTLVGVFPANVYSALTGGWDGGPGPLGEPWVAWARLPLQVPLVWAALRVARGRWWR